MHFQLSEPSCPVSREHLHCCRCSVPKSCPTLCDPMDCSTPGSCVSQRLLRFMFIESVMPSNHLILYCPFSSCLQSFPASGSFQMSRLFASGGQSIGVSASASTASVLPMNIHGWFPLEWTSLISLLPKRLQESSQNHNWKASVLQCSAFFMVQLSDPYMTTGKTIALTIQTFVKKWCLCFLICCLGFSWLSFQGANVF